MENARVRGEDALLHTDETKQHVLEEVKKRYPGDSIEKIAKENRISPRTVYSWCDKAGILPRRTRHKISEPPPKGDNHIDDTSTQKRNRELEQEVESQRRVIAILVEALRKSTNP